MFRDSQHDAMRSYSIKVLPTSLFIDQHGQIQHRELGVMTKSFTKEKFNPLLDPVAGYATTSTRDEIGPRGLKN
jgi:hypothetical protein